MAEFTGTRLRISSTVGSYDLHISGGLRAIPVEGGPFVLVPAGGKPKEGLPFQTFPALRSALADKPVQIFGLNEFGPRQYLQHRVWKPLHPDGSIRPPEADVWGWICTNAQQAGRTRIAALARSVSFSFRAAGIRFRDASDHFHSQLNQALEDRHEFGERFSNIRLYELYLAFHSMAAELGSARDYLASIVASLHGAPLNVESLARLVNWLAKPGQQHLLSDPILSEIMAAVDATGPDPWLAHLATLRNLFLHREPIQGSAKFLKMEQFSIGQVSLLYLTLAANIDGRSLDVLLEFIKLRDQLSDLAMKIASLPAFDTTIPHVQCT